ncbi:rod shape-determining protein RodA [Marivirga sp. S37H4]|uniref:Cell wall polymerase n=1 Tax=Marivirga aurantiaca TaxID=2802615 RepID=A0A934WZ95_9BACT|nr:rod shape-determining protein RodA [Marivirga aurantiaca]MBK6265934.1 rod shape-determining protein RodA [Marivirga aurantiaca]
MSRQDNIWNRVDWLLIAIFFVLVIFGWLNIYAVGYDAEQVQSIFNFTQNSGKQLVFIAGSLVIIIIIMILDFRFFDSFAYYLYAGVIVLLILILLFGTEISGNKSWFVFGPVRLQPSEFAKFTTALAVAKLFSSKNIRLERLKDQIQSSWIVLLPIVLIVMQGDAGTAMVFLAFVFVYYREGLPTYYLLVGVAAIAIFILTLMVEPLYLTIAAVVIGIILIAINNKRLKKVAMIVVGVIGVIGLVESVDYVINDVLKPHQQNRIKSLINPDADPLGYGWNVTQSKIAIGSGGTLGKGFLEGTQTKYDFVPEQSTDFIFCTIGEEHGWLGSFILITLFMALLLRIVFIAERQKGNFARIYGYAVACIFFVHFGINIGMTIGLFPVAGIPLPFFSYGGSSLWSFTILLFVLIKLDAHRMQVLTR